MQYNQYLVIQYCSELKKTIIRYWAMFRLINFVRLKKTHSHVLLDTSVITYCYVIISPSKTTNDQNLQQISTDSTENVDIEYQNKLTE